jgi:hypothetical protein
MLPPKYLLNHIDALLRLSHDVKDRAVAARLREIVDEFRLMVSVADITDFAAGLKENGFHRPRRDWNGYYFRCDES